MNKGENETTTAVPLLPYDGRHIIVLVLAPPYAIHIGFWDALLSLLHKEKSLTQENSVSIARRVLLLHFGDTNACQWLFRGESLHSFQIPYRRRKKKMKQQQFQRVLSHFLLAQTLLIQCELSIFHINGNSWKWCSEYGLDFMAFLCYWKSLYDESDFLYVTGEFSTIYFR